MRETLFVIACIIFGIAFRSCRTPFLRKLGAITFLLTTALAGYFIFKNIWGALAGALIWFLLPLFELLTRVRNLRLPLNNRLRNRRPPLEDHFPNAVSTIQEIEDAGFEHISDSGWAWGGMEQFFRIFWNAEHRQIATLCLCEQENAAFVFLTLSSQTNEALTLRSTNFPFSPTLKTLPSIQWNYLKCDKSSFSCVLREHQKFLTAHQLDSESLSIPDPDQIEHLIEEEMRLQIDHNLAQGLITLTGDGHFRYSFRGLLFLWKQFVIDMIRLC